MTINAGPEYFAAEKKYLQAQTLNEKILFLEEMLRAAPKHKSSENFVAELKTRLKKFREKQEKASKKSGNKKGIKKEGFQFVLAGKTKAGKSSLLAKLTNALPEISNSPFTTKEPNIGTFHCQGIQAQIIDLPSIGSEYFDTSIVHTSDCLLIVLESFKELNEISSFFEKAKGKKIFVFSKSDLLSQDELRKLEETIRAKKVNGIAISTISEYNIEKLKELMISQMSVIRVYTKEPHKAPTKEPMVLPINSNVKDIAEKILKGFSQRIKQARITGPSGKFPNQIVGLTHILKDKDTIEFHTK